MKNKVKSIHLLIIIIGIIFSALSAFHTNIWFDESYSVALATHSFTEIWQIGGHDVHPVLYYFFLHILYLIFGTNMIVYRLFSVLMIGILGIIGYTHIKKDFGEKVGLIFSFLSFFLPIVPVYSTEIRMYSMAILLSSLMGIYAYRVYKKANKLNWFLFGLFSLCLSYTHYYGLMIAGVLNLVLFIYFIKTKNIQN